MRAGKSGFTLIELMVVVIIIAALAGMVMPYLMDRPDEMKSKIAQGDIANIQTALKLYKLDNDKYPSSEEGLKALISRPSSAKNWKKPYIEKPPRDPWKQDYQYRQPGSRNKLGPDVWSVGVDGQNGTDDDVWPDSDTG